VTDEIKRRPGILILLLAVVVIFVLVAVILFFPPTGDGNGDDNGNGDDKGPWKDLTKMKGSISGERLFNYLEIEGPLSLEEQTNEEEMAYMMIGVESELTSEEIVAIRDFTLEGGSVIIADDGMNSNRLSNFTIGLTGGRAEFTGHNYLVDKFTGEPSSDPGWVHNIRFIKGYSLPIGGRVYSLLVDQPKGLYVTGDGYPVLTTTKNLTIIDINDNGEMDMANGEFEPHVPFGPFAARYDIGDNGGSITYFSTTGLFTDSMFDEAENEQFLKAYLFSLLPTGGRVVLDDSKQVRGTSPHTMVIPE
jgi:hypothetical protein